MRVCLTPRLSGVGGMVSFQGKLYQGLIKRGIEVNFDLNYPDNKAILVIGGTRNLPGLWRARQSGVRVVQRLDGMNWLHHKQHTGLRHYVRAEYGNILLAFIRRYLADHIVYQSTFVRQWWENTRGPARCTCSIIHNGIDLIVYSPLGRHNRPAEHYRILLVEGSLKGGYDTGIQYAVNLAKGLQSQKINNAKTSVELMIVGQVDQRVIDYWSKESECTITWRGVVPQSEIPKLDRSAHLLFSADINAACPNSVIEALACGLPVLAYDTGALPELVQNGAGRIVPYGGDPWELETPDLPPLVTGAMEILQHQDDFRTAAREHAESSFDLDQMVESYLQALTV